MTLYLIPFEYTGICKIEADTPEEAREMFEAMTDGERVAEAELWADDRTFTEAEYTEAIKEVREGEPLPA